MPHATENQNPQPPAGGITSLRKATNRIFEWLGCARREEVESLSAKVQRLEELLDVVARATARLGDKIENPEKYRTREECRE